MTQPSKHPRTETSYEKFRSSFGRGLSWAYSHSLSKLNHIEESFLTRWLIGGQTKAGDTEMAARWMSLRQRPIFTWAVPGKTHRSTMSKIIKTRAHLMAARLQISEHDNFTAKFLMREGNCREDLGEHWKDEGVSTRVERRLLQSNSFQFPRAANYKKWGWQEEDECTLCKALYPDLPASSECPGHIKGYCKALQKPRIAVHHGIGRELVTISAHQKTVTRRKRRRILGMGLSHISQCRQT